MEVSRVPASEANLSGSRIGLLGFPAEFSEALDGALNSTNCLATNLPTVRGDSSEPLGVYDILVVWAEEDVPTARAAELLATSQPWLLLGTEQRIRENSSLYLRADDVVFTPYALNELLFRIHRMIHRVSIGAQHSKRRKFVVLVADDDPSMVALLETVLRNNDWECHFATNGRQALVMERELLPDLVVLDIDMPFMTGLEVLRRIRETRADNVKVLLLTGSTELKHVEEGLSLGANDYLAKPFSHIALVHRVRKLLFSPITPLTVLGKAAKPA
jgi:DNA-binding response OmpR family regulator